MCKRLIGTAVLTTCICCFGNSPALSQVGARASISRPSTHAASRRLGRLGGYYTRQYGDVTGLTDVVPNRGSGPRGLERPNYFGAAWRIGQLPPAPVPQAFTNARIGYEARRARWPAFELPGAIQSSELSGAALMERSLRFQAPLMGYGPYEPQMPARPYFDSRRGENSFQEFFGLRPAQERPASDAPVPPDGLVGLLAQENQQILRTKRAEALRIFKLAMTRDTEDHADLVSQAERLLTDLRDLDRSAFLPNLLLIHTALEKQQLSLAINHLGRLVRLRPQVFSERPDVASYFGDPELLKDQMRAYLRIGDDNPSVATYTLQAYCAWVLDDRTRVEQALHRMVELHEAVELLPGIKLFQHAMTAAMRN